MMNMMYFLELCWMVLFPEKVTGIAVLKLSPAGRDNIFTRHATGKDQRLQS